jgi:excisionase family DNA binding protein
MLEKYNDVLTSKEVLDILHISKNTLYDLLNKNMIPYIKIGRSYRISKKSLIEFLGN